MTCWIKISFALVSGSVVITRELAVLHRTMSIFVRFKFHVSTRFKAASARYSMLQPCRQPSSPQLMLSLVPRYLRYAVVARDGYGICTEYRIQQFRLYEYRTSVLRTLGGISGSPLLLLIKSLFSLLKGHFKTAFYTQFQYEIRPRSPIYVQLTLTLNSRLEAICMVGRGPL